MTPMILSQEQTLLNTVLIAIFRPGVQTLPGKKYDENESFGMSFRWLSLDIKFIKAISNKMPL